MNEMLIKKLSTTDNSLDKLLLPVKQLLLDVYLTIEIDRKRLEGPNVFLW